MASKTYRLRGIFYRQEPLDYGQVVQLRNLLKGQFADFTYSQEALGKWLDRLIEQDIAPRALAIVLKLYEPTFVHRWLNRRAARRLGIDINSLDAVARIITVSPAFAAVMRDFFLFNVSWVETWLNTPVSLTTKVKRMSPAAILQSVTRASMQLAAATSSLPNKSNDSPPQP